MKRFHAFFPAILAALLLAGCLGGSNGSSSTPPPAVSVRAQDSRVTLTWPMQPGVEYWIYKAAGTGVSPQSCSSMPECSTLVNVTSPAVMFGLANGRTYSFSINGRTNGGPGGPGTPPVQAIPQVAGSAWLVGGSIGTSDLRGVAFGTSYSVTSNNSIVYANVYIAVGANGALFTSFDGRGWTSLVNPVPGVTLNAVTYNPTIGLFAAVGANGTIIVSGDGIVWTQQSSGTTNELFSVALNGAGGFIASGANGAILVSADGVNWIAVPSGTSNTLYGITYGATLAGLPAYLAVGAAGTVLYSPDAFNWFSISSGTNNALYAITNGVSSSSGGNAFVAVGAGGTVLYSENGLTWALQTAFTSANLNAATFGRLFVAAAEDGATYLSLDGQSWSPTNRYTTSPIYALTRGGPYSSLGIYDYAAVGAGGMNMYAD